MVAAALAAERDAAAAGGAAALAAAEAAARDEQSARNAAHAEALRAAAAELKAEHDKLLAARAESHASELAGVHGALQEREAAHGQLEAAHGATQQALEAEAAAHSGSRADLQAEAAAAVAAASAAHADEVSLMRGAHEEAARQERAEFAATQATLEEQIAELQQALAEAEQRFLDRPSREEDVRRIRELEKLLVHKDALVKKAREEMIYFKVRRAPLRRPAVQLRLAPGALLTRLPPLTLLVPALQRELLNREENFNKRFGASPNVGVMQVIKPQQGQQHVSMGGAGQAAKAAAKMKSGGKRDKARRMGAFPPLGPVSNNNMGKMVSSSSVGGLGMGMGIGNNNRRPSGSG